MAVSAKLYGQAFLSAFNKEIGYSSDTVKVMLCTSAYTPDQDGHRYLSSVTGEVVGTGYTPGGQVLASKVASYNAATNTVAFDAADVVWTGSTLTARYAVVYDAATGVAATEPVIAYIDFGADVPSSNGPFTITFDPSGIVTVTAA